MYLEFFGLKERPFNMTSDPNFLYMSQRHKEAFAHLTYGINERKGFLEITGEIGTGKTTLCRALVNSLERSIKTAFIMHSNLPELQLLSAIIEDFGLQPRYKSKLSMLSQLNDFLMEQLSLNCNVVLIIDEAQNLKLSTLEQVRLLSNLETEKEKLFQIILVGQPELREKLRSPGLRQLRQRIGVRYHILPLERNEVGDYVNHRLSVAGSNGGIIFEADALDAIYAYSGGIPRLINTACDKALLLAFVLEKRTITRENVQRAIEEIEGFITVCD